MVAPGEALIQFAHAFSEALSIEITPDDGSVVVVRLADDGPLVISHDGNRVDVVGGRAALDAFAEWRRFVAAGPAVPSEIPYHAHLESYPGHRWLAAESDPVVVTLSD